MTDPLEILGAWLDEAREARLPTPAAMTLVTATAAGRAEVAGRELAEELFAERPRDHQLQVLASRQGETIEGLGPLRERLEQLCAETAGRSVACPADWGAVRIVPSRVELWQEAPDRLHERRLFEAADDGWRLSRLAP